MQNSVTGIEGTVRRMDKHTRRVRQRHRGTAWIAAIASTIIALDHVQCQIEVSGGTLVTR
jgi:hypothetical protein